MKDPTSQLRSATRRAKSDVANKLVSMFLHELSREMSKNWPMKADSAEYEELVRHLFDNYCPYCSRDLRNELCVIEHLDGMNRYRAGLHVAGNVLIACKTCNNEKRRDDSLKVISLASSGWESFLSHEGSRCPASCPTCRYWRTIWPGDPERRIRMNENLERICSFRQSFPELQRLLPVLKQTLPALLTKVYSDYQAFAEKEIRSLLEQHARLLSAAQTGET